MFRWLFRAGVGLVCGYLAYIPFLLITERLMYGRIDSEKALYALYFPLGAPFLLAPSSWKSTPKEEIILNLIGGALLIVGVVAALKRRGPGYPQCGSAKDSNLLS